MPQATGTKRLDRDGSHRRAFDQHKKEIYKTQTHCGICGREVDFSQKFPHPMSPCIDHIIPIARGGHPSDRENLQLAHFSCNRAKADKLVMFGAKEKKEEVVSNRILPQSRDWRTYRPG